MNWASHHYMVAARGLFLRQPLGMLRCKCDFIFFQKNLARFNDVLRFGRCQPNGFNMLLESGLPTFKELFRSWIFLKQGWGYCID